MSKQSSNHGPCAWLTTCSISYRVSYWSSSIETFFALPAIIFKCPIFKTRVASLSQFSEPDTMAPDLNSLPPSRSPNNSPLHSRVRNSNTEADRHQTPSPRSSSVSLAAAASVNAGLQNRESRQSSVSSNLSRASPQVGRMERRISNTVASLSLNDPTLPGPGELQGPDHRSRRTSNSFGPSSRGTSRDDAMNPRQVGDLQRLDHGANTSHGHSWQTTSPSVIGGSPTIATGDPHHSRHQSLGELHQELEQEQEAQVVRLRPRASIPCLDRVKS